MFVYISDLNRHGRSYKLSNVIQKLRFASVAVLFRSGNPYLKARWLTLNNLAGQDTGNFVKHNEQGRNHSPIRSYDCVLPPSVQPSNTRHVPATLAGIGICHEFRHVSRLISNQWHAEIMETGSHDA